MKSDEYLENIITVGQDVYKNGINGFTQKEIAHILGIRQSSTFITKPPKTVVIGCWMLSLLSTKELGGLLMKSRNMMCFDFTPGMLSSEDFLIALDKSLVKSQMAEAAWEVLVEGASTSEAVTSPKRAALETACSSIVWHVKNPEGIRLVHFNLFLDSFNGVDLKMKPWVLFQAVQQTSQDFIRALLIGKKGLTINDVAMMELVKAIPNKNKVELSFHVANALDSVETFRYERYVQIRKLGMFLPGYENQEKPPVFLKFFDHIAKVQFPELKQLVAVFACIKNLKRVSADEIKRQFRERFGESKRIGILDAEEIKKLVDDGQSFSTAYSLVQPKTDPSIITKAYKAWEKSWAKKEYWNDSVDSIIVKNPTESKKK